MALRHQLLHQLCKNHCALFIGQTLISLQYVVQFLAQSDHIGAWMDHRHHATDLTATIGNADAHDRRLRRSNTLRDCDLLGDLEPPSGICDAHLKFFEVIVAPGIERLPTDERSNAFDPGIALACVLKTHPDGSYQLVAGDMLNRPVPTQEFVAQYVAACCNAAKRASNILTTSWTS